MTKIILVACIALIMPVVALAAGQAPHYAMYEYKMAGPKATVRIVQLVIVDGDKKACLHTLSGIKKGHSESISSNGASQFVTYGREGCLREMPVEFIRVVDRKNIADAYYVARTLELKNASDEYFDIFYGMNIDDPIKVCMELMSQFASNRRFKNYKCVGPRLKLRNKTTVTRIGSDGVIEKHEFEN